MPLHLAHHKSYPRVRRDEERQKKHEDATEGALRAMDRSARLEELRRRKREAEHGPDAEKAMPPEHINFWAEYEARHAPERAPEGAPFGARTKEWYAGPPAEPSAKDADIKTSSDPLNMMNAYLFEKQRASKEHHAITDATCESTRATDESTRTAHDLLESKAERSESGATSGTESAANVQTNVPSSATSSREFHESIYVELLQEMICTVLGGESHLFTPEEIECFSAFMLLDHSARNLFARLLQRKREWHRVDKLALGADAAASDACTALCRPFAQPGQVYRFAAGDAELCGEPRLAMLTLDELRTIAKQLGIQRRKTRDETVAALLAPAMHAPLFGAQSRGERLERLVDAQLPLGCIRLEESVFVLFDRLALVYYRGRPAVGALLTAAVLARTHKCHFPEYTLDRSTDIFPSRQHVLRFQSALEHELAIDALIEERTLDAARRGIELLDQVFPVWEHAVRELWITYPDGIAADEYAKMRYHYGWVYTRVVHKACECLARLKHAPREEGVLRALLSQRFFRRGRRGSWFERLAIISAREKGKQAALDVCLEALSDQDMHVSHIYALQRRVERLETQLRIAIAKRHHFRIALREAPHIEFSGVRGAQRGSWVGRDGACSVEHFCLEKFEEQGYKGAHDEGAGLLFVFVLLMWDVLFQPAKGAFETAYQREPLDLASDVFFVARQHAIDKRLHEIQSGGAREILRVVDKRERRKRTWAVACRWDDYSTDDLDTIVDALGGHALAHICRILAQDWSSRTSGLPDLMLWQPGQGTD
ncbi:phosphodiesterase I [Malassezia cuniculi]|uniref:Fanconi-associated nuclease n=1 Tax=Malassezia cuniculi TaxID=948313 RepID=A0AAF0EQR8_9BASI|nr:phosphodiesterase I [Malassezia cuniculi]